MTGFAHPIKQTLEIEGTPFFDDFEGEVEAGIPLDVFKFTVPIDTIRRLHNVIVICRQPGELVLTINGGLAGSGKTGPGKNTINLPWVPGRDAAAGQEVKGVFTLLPNKPKVDIKAHLQAADISV